MNEFRADLHCHTTCSDGTLTPEQLIRAAEQKGLNGLSITDHDTVEAYATAVSAADNAGISLVSGAEFSAVLGKTGVHILAYSFSPLSPVIREFCTKHIRRRKGRNEQILSLLAAKGMPVSDEDIAKHTGLFTHTIGRPHIALAMMHKGYVSSVQEAFHKYIGEGKPCYAPGGYFTVEETLETIRRANGLAVLAHPHLIKKTDIIDELLRMNFDGLEAYYAGFPAEQNERWVKIATRKNLLPTGGSDFHGDIKPGNQPGSSWTNEETFKILHRHYAGNQPHVL